MMKLAEIQAACGVLCVDLAAVVDNYQTLARHVAPAQCGAVLKANGYGLGAEAIAPALYAANCRIFFVAQLSEGVVLRNILSADAMVVLLNGVMPQAMPFCCAQQITPLLNSVDQVMAWLALQEARSQRRPVLIQLDSGMSRLGVTPEQLARLAAIFRQRGWAAPDYIISHLANADRPDHALNVYQHTLLQQAKEAFPTSRYSLANSCGMFLHPAWREDLCRPGVALFGVAQPWFSTPLKPAFTLTLTILRVQDAPVGTPIGYGRRLLPPARCVSPRYPPGTLMGFRVICVLRRACAGAGFGCRCWGGFAWTALWWTPAPSCQRLAMLWSLLARARRWKRLPPPAIPSLMRL